MPDRLAIASVQLAALIGADARADLSSGQPVRLFTDPAHLEALAEHALLAADYLLALAQGAGGGSTGPGA